MKKVLIVLFLAAVLICALNDEPKKKTTFTQEELWEAEHTAYERGFDEGYDLAQYEARGEIEQAMHDAEGEIDRIISEYGDNAFEAGYERGYEEGYDDCLEEHGLAEEYPYNPYDPPRIKKDK